MPNDGPGTTTGPKLAYRILHTRAEREFNRFDSLDQISAYFDYHATKYPLQQVTFNTWLERAAFKSIPATINDPAGSVTN